MLSIADNNRNSDDWWQAYENNEEMKLKMQREGSEDIQSAYTDKVCLVVNMVMAWDIHGHVRDST